jgi:CSLREA domain-containing protein
MKNKIILSILGCLAVVNIASAVTFNVNTTTDAVDAVPGNGVCLTAAGKCSLRAAIQEANFNANSDIVVLPAGTYSISIAGLSEDANLTGDFDILQPLEIRGSGIDTTIINGASLDRIFDAKSGKNFILKDLTIKGGNVLTSGEGGAVRYVGNAASLLTIDGVDFFKNKGSIGGALFAAGDSKVTITDSNFEGNIAQSAGGAYLAITTNAVNVSDSLFSSNLSLSSGASLIVSADVNVNLFDLEFEGNDGGMMAGAFVAQTSADLSVSNIDITDSKGGGFMAVGNNVVFNNVKNLGTSCGIVPSFPAMIQASANVTLNGATINDSECGMVGVMQATAGGAFTAKNLVAKNNLQNMVGGIGTLFINSGLDMSFDGLDVSGNTAKGITAGIYISSAQKINLKNSKINDNLTYGTGGFGGGLISAGMDMNITDVLVQGNQAEIGVAGGLAAVSGANVIMNRTSLIDNVCSGSSCVTGNLYTQGTNSFFDNSTSEGGSSDKLGGGISVVGGTLNIRNSTITNNFALEGGSGIYNANIVNIGNSILSDNKGSNTCFGNPLVSTNNNIVGDASCGLAGSADQIGVSAKLKPAQSFGTFVVASDFNVGSPAIDKGRNSTCLAKDQRGVTRPFDGNQDGIATCDIGAIESDDLCPTDVNKKTPGVCGCGTADTDANANGITDCLLNQELEFNVANLRTTVSNLRKLGEDATPKKKKKNRELRKAVSAQLEITLVYGNTNAAGITVSSADSLTKLLEDMNKAVKKARRTNSNKFKKNRKAALKNIDKLVGLI